MIKARGLQAEIYSLRKYLNIIDNFNAFLKFNSGYEFISVKDFIVHLLVLKEAWHPIYEALIQSAIKNQSSTLSYLISELEKNTIYNNKPIFKNFKKFLDIYYFKINGEVFEEKLYKLIIVQQVHRISV